MGIFTDHLSREHLEIRRGLERLKHLLARSDSKARLSETLSLIEALRTYLEEVHHGKEEHILFPTLDHLRDPLPGGPNCTEHMGHYLEWDLVGTIDRTASSTSNSSVSKKRDNEISPAMDLIVARNPFLGIPLSEHKAGHQGLALIENELRTPSGQPMAFLASVYLQLMDSHIRKEDDCLFKMVDRLLPDPLQKELLSQATMLEERLGADRVRDARLLLAA